MTVAGALEKPVAFGLPSSDLSHSVSGVASPFAVRYVSSEKVESVAKVAIVEVDSG